MLDPEPPRYEKKEVTHHPLENNVKYKYAPYLKYAHNSVNNPMFPKPKEPHEDIQKYTFSIFGIQTNEAFIYVKYLIEGLYKYNSKDFDAPVIRAVNSVEWMTVLADLKIRYGGLTYCLSDPVVVLLNDKVLGGIKELKEFVQSKYNYYLKLNYTKLSVDAFANYVDSMSRPCVYMHISIDDVSVGTLIFMVYSDIVPLTSENFLRLCLEPKGGYSGTPVHRIVKDGWIQCGGFGLKSTPLECENFIIPHDRRGVLCMANDGRHRDCSTQFFVLLQPAPWMAHKYVAFGQLIEGDETLRKIESVPTFYESPNKKITIDKTGILNMKCQDRTINKETNAYIHGHIEDLINLASTLWEELMKRVNHAIDLLPKKVKNVPSEQSDVTSVHETKSFRKEKHSMQASNVSDNNDFDVESYEYEPEEYIYPQVTPVSSAVVPPEAPYYIPLTDLPYPGETDSTYDLKKYVRGDYCLESDINPNLVNINKNMEIKRSSYDIPLIFENNIIFDDSVSSLDSEDEFDVKRYIKFNSDKDSFAGNVIKGISKAGTQINLQNAENQIFTDEGLRKLSLVSHVRKHPRYRKKVSMSVEPTLKEHSPIRRRPTGFIRNKDMDIISLKSERSFDGSGRKVRILDKSKLSESDKAFEKQSVMGRLFHDAMNAINEGQLTKDHRLSIDKYIAMTYSPLPHKAETGEKDAVQHLDLISLHDKMLLMQHGHPFGDNVSTDYVRSLMHPKSSEMKSLRAHEFAKCRPMMSVNEYKARNRPVKKSEEVKDLYIAKGRHGRHTNDNTPDSEASYN